MKKPESINKIKEKYKTREEQTPKIELTINPYLYKVNDIRSLLEKFSINKETINDLLTWNTKSTTQEFYVNSKKYIIEIEIFFDVEGIVSHEWQVRLYEGESPEDQDFYIKEFYFTEDADDMYMTKYDIEALFETLEILNISYETNFKSYLTAPLETIEDFLSTALNGSQWAGIDSKRYKEARNMLISEGRIGSEITLEKVYAKCLKENLEVKIIDLEDDFKEHYLTLEKIDQGFEIVSKKYPHLLANEDFSSADAILQCAIFGDIIYG